MMRTGNVLVPDELNSANIHRLENVMTMEQGVHGMFDCLALWLETTVRWYSLLYRECN